jgi:hypothetical protein
MTPAEKNQLLQFMGQTYGQVHQQDQMIVGQAGNLKPGSQEFKQSFENAAKLPVQEQYSKPNVPGSPPAPVQAPPVEISTVTPEQAATELAQPALPTPPPAPPSVLPPQSNQLELDLSELPKLDKIIKVLKEQNLLLKQISLKLDNGKKVSNKKSG